MSITRRKFLKAGTLVALVAAFPLRTVLGQDVKDRDGNPNDQNRGPADPLSYYSRSAFSSHLNSIFQLNIGYSTVAITLVEVKDLTPGAATAQTGGECFSLLFRGGSTVLEQNTYRIEHPSLGTFQLFLVPGGADEKGTQSHVAIVNRLANSPDLIAVPTRSAKTTALSPDEKVSKPAKATPAAPVTRRRKEGFDIISPDR